MLETGSLTGQVAWCHLGYRRLVLGNHCGFQDGLLDDSSIEKHLKCPPTHTRTHIVTVGSVLIVVGFVCVFRGFTELCTVTTWVRIADTLLPGRNIVYCIMSHIEKTHCHMHGINWLWKINFLNFNG